MLESAADTQLRDLEWLPAADLLAVESDRAAARRQRAADQIEHRALACAVRSDQAENLAGPDLEREIVDRDQPAEFLARMLDGQQRRRAARPRTRRGNAAAAATVRTTSPGSNLASHGHTPSRVRCSSMIISMPKTTISKLPSRPSNCGSQLLQQLLQQRDQRRADDRAPDAAGAADHRHEQVLDALVDAERRRIDEALQMRIQPPGNAGEQRGVDEDDDLQRPCVDAEGLGHFQPALERAHRPARPRVEQIVGRPQADQHDQPDQVVDMALVAQFPAEK